MTPDKDRCLGNIYRLAKKKGLRIGDLETSCGVSIGYLARLRQDKKQTLPGSEFLFHAAALLDTTVDYLLNYDDRFATDSEKYLSSFIRQMIRDTMAEKLFWQLDPAFIPSPFISDKTTTYPDHPLIALDPVLMQEGKSKEIYLSPFHPSADDLVPLSAWRTALSSETDVFLIRISQKKSESACAEPWDELELYLYDRKSGTVTPLCHTNTHSPGFLDHDLADLFATVGDSFQTRPLVPSAQDAIDRYMNSHTD